MIRKSLIEISEMCSGKLLNSEQGKVEIIGISTDSRNIQKYELFIPLIGEKFNGHQHIAPSMAACLWQEDQIDPPSDVPIIMVKDTLRALQELAKSYLQEVKPKVIAITGSNGKTSTKDIVSHLLTPFYTVHKTHGNFNNHIGVPLTILLMPQLTEVLVVELGMSNRGEISFLSQLVHPDMAVITNIGESHLMQLGSRQEIANEKWEIVDGLNEQGMLIFPGDEPLLKNRKLQAHQVSFSFGRSDQCDLRLKTYEARKEDMVFSIYGEKNQFVLPLLGNHHVSNALAALSVMKCMGVSLAELSNGFEGLELSPMRSELLQAKDFFIYNDTYNASPTAVKAIVELIRDLQGYPRKIFIFGDMLELGEKEIEFHRDIGRFVNPESIDYFLTFGQLSEYSFEEAKSRFSFSKVCHFKDKALLIQHVKSIVRKDDLIAIKGSRGMKLEQVVHALLAE